MISIIAAITKNRVLGKDNKLLWNIPEDLKNFRKITSGNTVVMGRKTFKSIGKPLPNRNNIVISRDMPAREGFIVCHDLNEAINQAKLLGKEIFIIGGASIYAQTLPLADRLYLSHINKEYEGDVYFPEFDPKDFDIIDRKDYPDFEFIVYKRK